MEEVKFYLGDETHVVIEDKNRRKGSLFASQYDYAFSEIKAVLPAICSELCTKDKHNGEEGETISELIPNNVFTFIGDRGTGKTSCMLSVASMLKKTEEVGIDKKCHVVDVVDPSFFDDKVNILDIVIGKLFSSFKESLKRRPTYEAGDDFNSKKTQLYDAFQMVRNCLVNSQHKDENVEESVEYLSNLASSVELQQAMHRLVDRFLLFYNEDLMVIPIDDIDLHTKCAYEMVEQVRKYLVQKNIIVLMAVRMEQLRTVIDNEYANQYRISLEKGLVGSEYINDMAARYLVKFVPQSHRIFMPDMKVYMDTSLHLFDGEKQVWPNSNDKPVSLKYAVTELIFQKTRYLFYHNKGVMSPIVPSNLREIRHLISLLFQMPDYRKNGKKHDENKAAFKHYFFETWALDNLDSNGKESIWRIESLRDVSIFNKAVLQELKERFEVLKDSGEEWIADILDDKNAAYNISMGDVFSVIDYIKKRGTKSYDFSYIFALETLYSMRMYEYYDYMTETDDNVSVDLIDESIKKRSMFDEIRSYHILAGGSFMNSFSVNYVANRKNGSSRNPRQLKLSKIAGWIQNNDPVDSSALMAAELMSLFIARRDYSSIKKKGIGSNYRTSGDLVYYEPLLNVDNVTFDVTSLLYNITNIRQAYERVDDELFKIASNRSDSLYNRLLTAASNRDNRNRSKEAKLLSWVCIRNSEILEDFSDTMSTKVTSSGDDDVQNYIDFLKKVRDYKIKTYDKDEDDNPYNISFDYVKVILEIMTDPVKKYIEEVMVIDEPEYLTDSEYGAIIRWLDGNIESFNNLGKLASGKIKSLIKEIVPKISDDKLKEAFPMYKSFSKNEIQSKLKSLTH